MRALRIGIKSGEDGRIEVSRMSVIQEGTGIVEDKWDTIMNVLRLKSGYGYIHGGGGGDTGGHLILDIGKLDINTLG